MTQFRKKPVVIEAYQMATREDAAAGVCLGGVGCPANGPDGAWPHIHTLEGDHTWTPGDFVIRGVKGEYYFCKPDIFEATYEPASSGRAAPRAHTGTLWHCDRCGRPRNDGEPCPVAPRAPDAPTTEHPATPTEKDWSADYWQLDQAVLDAKEANRHHAQIARLEAIRDRIDALNAAASRSQPAAPDPWTPELLQKLADECDRVPDTEHATERLAEARVALARVMPPSSPEQDKDRLYYPLLFLCETVEPVLRWLNDDERKSKTTGRRDSSDA